MPISGDQPERFDDLLPDDRLALLSWIGTSIVPAKTFDKRNTSYGMKHKFEHDSGIYVCNGAFKGAMLHCGYSAQRVDDTNWHFNARIARSRQQKIMADLRRGQR